MSTATNNAELEIGLPLACDIETESSYQLGSAITVKGTIHNSGSSAIWILSRNTFLEPDWRRCLLLSHDGSSIPYIGVAGLVPNKDSPSRESYVRIPAGRSLSRQIDIKEKYGITDPGEYQISFSLPIVGGFETGDGEPPVAQNQYNLTVIESRKATFRIDGDASAAPRMKAEALDLSAQGTAADYPPMPKPPKCEGMNSEESKEYTNAYNLAYAHILEALKSVTKSVDTYEYNAWFELFWLGHKRSGWEERRAKVKKTFTAMADLMSTSSVILKKEKVGLGICKDGRIAAARLGAGGPIYLCPHAFDDAYLRTWYHLLGGKLIRSYILVHELSHAVPDGAVDVFYEWLIVEGLSTYNPGQAVANAENYACFAMGRDSPPLPGLKQLGFTRSAPFVDSAGWVWFQNYDDSALKKVRFDGTPGSTKGATWGRPVVVGDWVYYREPLTNKLMRLKTDGTTVPQNIGGAQTLASPFVTSDGWVWFVGMNSELMKISVNGGDAWPSGAQTLAAPFVTSDGWVWFVGMNNDLMKISPNGGDALPGGARTLSTPFVTSDGWVWFQGYYNNALERMFKDGSQASNPLGSLTLSSPFVLGDWIYFQGTDNALWRQQTKLNDPSRNRIGSTLSECYTKSTPFVSNGFVFFQGTNDALWVCSVDF